MSPQSPNGDLFPWEIPGEGGMDATAAALPDASEEAVAEEAPAARRAVTGSRGDDRAGDSRGGGAQPRPGAARDRSIVPREYYSISEVCEIVGLKPHVLRYWETQFPPLSPSKNRSGNRVYQRKEIKLIMLVKKLLYEEKYTVEGARAKLEQLRRSGRMKETTGRALRADAVDMLRTELESLHRILSGDRND
jgi:DNA-binding transcriptional MerR regulator